MPDSSQKHYRKVRTIFPLRFHLASLRILKSFASVASIWLVTMLPDSAPAASGVGVELWRQPAGVQSRSVNFENPTGGKGSAAQWNHGGKGHPCEFILPGETKVLMDYDGCGIIQRIWMTLEHRKPADLRGFRLDIYWDSAKTPAVSAPLADFFNFALAKMTAFDCELFSSPEGKSFNCFIPMPFRKHCRITLKNENTFRDTIFYDISLLTSQSLPDDARYFHAYWHRVNPTKVGTDFEILPRVRGTGRFLGCNIGIITDPFYESSWWGEGEVKMYLDGDNKFPTIASTGTEDYILAAWGQKVFNCRYSGATVGNPTNRQWGFYRHHIPDTIYFEKDCRITIQQLGGDKRARVAAYQEKNGDRLIPTTLVDEETNFVNNLLLDLGVTNVMDPSVHGQWANFYRSDDVSACAYFYLDKPENGLPPLQPLEERTAGLESSAR